jgi:hypothetical protein
VSIPYKYGGYIPVSRELLAESSDDRLLRAMRGELTEQEKAEDRAGRERQAAQRAAKLAEHQRRMETATGLRRAVLELHGPAESSSPWLECGGCDYAGYEAEPPIWPCRTYRLVAEWEGQP